MACRPLRGSPEPRSPWPSWTAALRRMARQAPGQGSVNGIRCEGEFPAWGQGQDGRARLQPLPARPDGLMVRLWTLQLDGPSGKHTCIAYHQPSALGDKSLSRSVPQFPPCKIGMRTMLTCLRTLGRPGLSHIRLHPLPLCSLGRCPALSAPRCPPQKSLGHRSVGDSSRGMEMSPPF